MIGELFIGKNSYFLLGGYSDKKINSVEIVLKSNQDISFYGFFPGIYERKSKFVLCTLEVYVSLERNIFNAILENLKNYDKDLFTEI